MSCIDSKKSEEKDLSRRGFIKGTTALVGAGLLAGANLNATEPRTPEAVGVAESCGPLGRPNPSRPANKSVE